VFTNVINPRSAISRREEFLPTLVKRGASIGANATIICGATLGEYCFIGAGALVRGEVPAYALMLGVPARQAGWICRCGVRLELSGEVSSCASCGTRYREAGGKLSAIELAG